VCRFTIDVAVLRTSLPRTNIASGRERASLLRRENVSGLESAKGRSCFLYICLIHIFPFDKSNIFELVHKW
jgi:hypothetical protein